MIEKKAKNKIYFAIRLAVSVLLIALLVLGFITINNSDKKIAAEANKKVEAYKMDLPDVDYGEEGFKQVAQNDKLTMLANIPTGEIAIKDNGSGEIWYSNPQDRENDTSAVMVTRASAQVMVKVIARSSGNELTVDSRLGCVLRKGLDYKLTDNGIKFIYNFPQHGLVIPVEYTLLSDSFEAKIVGDEIKELNTEQFRLMQISLLPFFSCGSLDTSGYMFVPDGSGALINFNNGKINCAEYSSPIYGFDYLVTDKKMSDVTQKIRMPVFGNKTDDKAFLGVVTSGEAAGLIGASIGGVLTGYNQVYTSIDYRDAYISTVEKNGEEKSFTQYGDSNIAGTDFSVRFFLLKGKDADYSGMANCYRKYLIDSGVLTEKSSSRSALALELYGAIRTFKNVLGVNKEIVTPMTDYNTVYKTVEALLGDGVENFDLLYKGWNKGGLQSATCSKIYGEKELGGKKELEKLLDITKKNDIKLYLDCDFSNLYKSGNGLSNISDAAKVLSQDSAKLFEYKLATKEKNKDLSKYLISTSLFESLTNKFSNNAKKFGINSVVETSFGSQLYSDLTKDKVSLRYQTQTKIAKSLENMSKNLENVAVVDGNIYTIPYCDTVFDVPTDNSDYDIFDETVPFYSMVLHGYVQMTTESVNFSESYDKALLKAIETGCTPKYTLIASDTSNIIGTQYSNLFNVNLDDWYDKIVQKYISEYKVFERLNSLEITYHIKEGEDIFSTIYEDGTKVTVNYNSEPVKIDGKEIDALSYAIS